MLLIATGFGATVAEAQQPKVFNLGYVGRPTSPEGIGATAFAEEVKKRSNGRLEIRLHSGGALGGEREMLEGLQIGTVDIAMPATAVVGNFVPEVQILDIPFLFRDIDHAYRVLDGPIGQEMLAKFPSKNLVGLAMGGNGFRQLTNSKKPVTSPDDLRGLKLRTMENQTHLMVWRQLGAQPTPMSLPEVFTALQQGVVDGQENPIGAIINNKFGQVQKHLTITNHAFTSIAVVMSPTAYNALSAEDKKIMVDGARLAMQVTKDQVAIVEKTGIDTLRGMGLVVVEKVDTARFQELLKPTYAELAKKFGDGPINRIKDTR
ncbi:MAG: TRAP transporter substrate-binding protein [Casimicrobiaceae bacterium]